MTMIRQRLKSVVAAAVLSLSLAVPGFSQEPGLDDLFDALQAAEGESAKAIEGRIWEEWSQSGSPAMDLLLQRGREALEAGDIDRAIEHFSALIDHAPDFAEGYNARATAYFQKGLYGPSLEDIEQTLARNPRHFGALSGLALILEELGIKDGALAAYRAVEEMYPAREGLDAAIDRLSREIEGESI